MANDTYQNDGVENLRDRAAKALGWSETDARAVSLASLRELLRFNHPNLSQEIANFTARGDHIVARRRR
jgi:hypothetical protein